MPLIRQETLTLWLLCSTPIVRIRQFPHPKNPLFSTFLSAVFFLLLWLFVLACSLQLLRLIGPVFVYTKLKELSLSRK